MHLELFGVLDPVGVEDRVVAVALLIFVGVEDVLVGAGLVHEAPAVGVDLEPGLGADPEKAAVAGLDRVGAGLLVGTDGGAVEHHDRVRLVHLGAGPEAGADAVAAGAGQGAGAADDAEVPGLQGLHHLPVLGVAAGGDHDALRGVVAHVLAVGVLGDDAGHAAVLLLELDHLRVVVEAGALLGGVLLDDLSERDLEFARLRIDRELRRVADGEVLVAGFVVLVAGLMPELDVALGEAVADPVDGFAGLVAPELDEVLLDVAARVLRGHRDELELVDLGAPGLLVAGVDGAEVLADARADGESVDADHLAARFGSGGDGEEAARAAADDENVGLVRGDDVLFGDFGLLAEPVAVVFVGLLVGDDFNGNFALGLRNALGGGLGDGLRRDRGAGDAVDFGGLSGHQVLLERVGGGLTDPRGFVGDVEHDVDDAVGVKGHRDRDFADAGGLGGIRAWPVDAGGSRTSGRSGERGAARNARAEECTTGERLVHDEFRIEWDPQGEAAGLP